MKSGIEQACTAAKSRASVLITGAQGTGRTTIAHAIPAAAHQAKERLTHVPIADLPEELVDDLIAGRLAPAHDHEGPALPTCWNAETLILDDVQSLSRTRQAQLLAALEQRQTLPRLIATASDDLEDRVADGRFLKPLATRLDQARITLPTLADRSSHDLISLATHFLNRRDPSRSLAPDLLQWVASRSWPGNLVELDQFIARLATDNNAPSLRLCHLPGSQRESSGTVLLAESDYERPWAEVADLASERIESAYFRQLMPLCNGRVDRCAQRSGMSRRSVGEKLSRHGIDKADYRPTRPRGGS